MARLKAKVSPTIKVAIKPLIKPITKPMAKPKIQRISRRKQIANVIEMSRSKSDPTNEISELDPPEFHPDCEICQELVKDVKMKN